MSNIYRLPKNSLPRQFMTAAKVRQTLVLGSLAVMSWLTFATPRAIPEKPISTGKPANGFVGTASCSGGACHGGLNTDPPLRAEYTLWARRDPHAPAYEVLANERSRQMVRNL